MDILDHDVGRKGARRLVVLLHGYRSSAEELGGLIALTQECLPDADVYVPDLPIRRWNTTEPAEVIVASLVERIDKRCGVTEYASIVLVGHSSGGVLARKVFLGAWGAADDVVDDSGKPMRVRPWANKIKRIVFIAAVNRGWTPSSATSYVDSLLWRLGSLVNDVVYRGRCTILQTRRGARFLVNTRLQWLALMRDAAKPAQNVLVIQLLGTVDDVVSPDDAIDRVADCGRRHVHRLDDPGLGRFFLLELPNTGHRDAIKVDSAADPRLRRASVRRRAIIGRALSGEPSKLASHPRAIRLEFIDDEPPSPAEADVCDVVFVIHGIRDRGFWTKKIARKIREHASDPEKVRCVTATYGYFPMAPFVVKWGRQEKVEWFMDLYCEVSSRYPAAAFSYVGHSNGTYLLAKALKDYPGARFKSIVFAGSVVRRDFPWRSFVGGNRAPRVQRFLNYVATNDWVVGIFPKGLQFFRWFDLGSAGHDGFEDLENRRQAGLGRSVLGERDSRIVDANPWHLNQITYVNGTHSAGLRESQWDDIARFVLDGVVPSPTNPDFSPSQTLWLKRVSKASTLIVVGVELVCLGVALLPIWLLFAPKADVWWGTGMTTAFFLWCALVWTVFTKV